MKKKLLNATLVLLVAIAICSFASGVEAAQSDAVAVKVTITPTISVSLTEDTLSLGSLNTGATKLSASAVTVTNNGSGINETYSLSVTNPSGWTASQAAAGQETYVLNAAFDGDGTGITWGESAHALSTTPVASSSSKFSGDATGASAPYNTARKLWFQFKAPTITAITSEQSIVVTVTAQAS